MKPEFKKENIEQLKHIIQEVKSKHNIEFNFSKHDDEIYDSLASLFNDERISDFSTFFDKKYFIFERIKENKSHERFFDSETILLAYYLSTTRRHSLPTAWPFELTVLQTVYSDMGISPNWAVV